jgi:hypothetical protein
MGITPIGFEQSVRRGYRLSPSVFRPVASLAQLQIGQAVSVVKRIRYIADLKA